jgi:predicted Zn finger-like uncharacterized protein
MISAECESCKASYSLDESRIPAAGIKMRCTKCGSSFTVQPGAATAEAAPTGAPVAAPAPAIPTPSRVGPMRTLLGIASVPLPSGPLANGPAAPFVPKPPSALGKRSVPAPSAAGASPPASLPPLSPPSSVPEEIDLDVDFPAPRGFTPGPLPPPTAPSLAPPSEPFADIDLDLPAPRRTGAGDVSPFGAPPPPAAADAASFADLDFDLPAPRRPTGTGLPPASAPDDSLNFDLPALRGNTSPGVSTGLDFGLAPPEAAAEAPALKRSTGSLPRTSVADLDALDLPTPSARTTGPELPRPSAQSFDGLDLPLPRSTGVGVGPAPSFGDLPQVGGAVGLGSEFDLPMARAAVTASPMIAVGAAVGGSGFGELDLPVSRGAMDFPTPSIGGSLGSFELPLPPGRGAPSALPGDLDLPLARPAGADDASLAADLSLDGGDELRSRDGKRGVGGAAFGELDLDAVTGAAADGPSGFAGITGPAGLAEGEGSTSPAIGLELGAGGAARVRVPVAAVADGLDEEELAARRRKRIALGALAALVLVGGTGAALGSTRHGFFGVYALETLLPAAGNAASASRAAQAAERVAASDTYGDVRAGLASLAAARREEGLNRALLARSAVHESLYQHRFGVDSASSLRVSRIFSRLEERGVEGPEIALARAASSLARGDLSGARSLLAAAGSPRDAIVELLAGEIALAEGAAPEAIARFSASLAGGGGARAQWGLARALLATRAPGAAAAVDATLAASPKHVGARIAKARALAAAGDLAGGLRLAREAAGATPVGGAQLSGSRRERVEALAWIGAEFERRGLHADASVAYEAALRLAPQELDVLLGAGRVLLTQRRYSDALARFEAATGVQPQPPAVGDARSAAQDAKLGAAQAMLHIERAQDARALLTRLARERPADPDVLLALGRAALVLEDQAAAELHFREAVTAAPTRFDGYLALARLFSKTGRQGDATTLLDEASRRVPETAEMHRLLGESELDQNRIPEAITQFRAALALDAADAPSAFGLGVALRRAGELAEAAAAFDTLAARDEAYPGLSLERGLLYEAKGEAGRATAMYEEALRAHPDDPDLLLRLGSSQVAAGEIDEAEQTLRRVAVARPNSAEAEHFMGRIEFARGRLQGAQQHFDRAVSLDGTRGEFHLYSGWAALDAGNYGKALEHVEAALARDPSLADAWWIRGEVRLRSGAVQDALADLEKALSLKPGRHEARAAVADCYDQLRRRPDAIRAYQSAIEGVPENGAWWYRLGRLQLDDDRAADARATLTRAVLLGEAMGARPGWLADAHRILGESLRLAGDRAGAREHFERYLAIASPNAIDREDVERQLEQLGAP